MRKKSVKKKGEATLLISNLIISIIAFGFLAGMITSANSNADEAQF